MKSKCIKKMKVIVYSTIIFLVMGNLSCLKSDSMTSPMINLLISLEANQIPTSGTGTVHAPGDLSNESVGGVNFNIVSVPPASFPTGAADTGSATVSNAYWVGQTEVTYELWSAVYTWATTDVGGGVRADGGPLYSLSNPGVMGDGTGDTNQHPVTTVSWRNVMVWTNALTEYYNNQNGTSLACVYTTDAAYSTCIRTATNSTTITSSTPGSQDDPYVNPHAKGFRLPTMDEWVLAARYKGSDSTNGAIEYPIGSGNYWTPGSYASGATAAYTNFDATSLVAWFGNSTTYGTGNTTSTQPVGQKTANTLGVYDMGGNVWEYNFDWYNASYHEQRSGAWSSTLPNYTAISSSGGNFPYSGYNDLGFRLVMTR